MFYHIITYGCQMNKSDSQRIAALLENTGFQKTLKAAEADLIVVNMCSVRQTAVDRVFGQARNFQKLKTKNRKLRTILTGCILKKDKIKFKENFDFVLSIKDLPKWPIFKNLPRVSYSKCQNSFTAFVPIMTGCNNFCSYCVVPYVRGSEVSRPQKDIICEVRNLVKRGCKEIWLLGQNVNSFSPVPFSQLLRKVNDIPGKFWIRFTSSHPKDFSKDLIEAIRGCQKVTEYLNLPVQSGDNTILKKMNRPYTVKNYKEIIQKVRQKIPSISLSTDVIVGFPGETKKQFENTLKLFEEIKFDMAYIAQYSLRPGTAASKLKDNVPKAEKQKRWKALSKTLQETALKNNMRYIGKTIEVLPDKEKNGFLFAKSRTYKTVKFQVQASKANSLMGKFVKVKILNATPFGLKGELI